MNEKKIWEIRVGAGANSTTRYLPAFERSQKGGKF